MSSLIGHAVTGAAIAFARGHSNRKKARRELPLLVLLAIAPDFDYLALWLLGVDAQPRATHSLCFCLGAATVAWALGRAVAPQDRPSGFVPLALAACSHLLLDLLVGVHSLPLLWPFSAIDVVSPIGVLPSAAHVSLTNRYLWRNLAIELGILVPMLLIVVWRRGGTPAQALLRRGTLLVPIWLKCLLWSISLQR